MTEKPWYAFYDKTVPAHLKYPDVCVQELLYQQAKGFSQKTALVEQDKEINYSQLVCLSTRFAETLRQMGLEHGNRVSVCLPNSIDFVVAYFGILIAGGSVAAMNPIYPLPEWLYQVNIAKPAILIGLKSRWDDLKELQTSITNCELIVIESDPQKNCNLPLSDVSDSSVDDGQGLKKCSPDQIALLQFSGGTTGNPKAAMASHRNVVVNVVQFSSWLTNMNIGQEVFLTAIPLYHVYGMVIGLNVGIAMGATIVLTPDARDVKKIINLAQKYQVTFFPGVPSMFQAINQQQDVISGKVNLHSIKACISGSAPLHEETRISFERLTGAKLVEGYGLSEAPTATHCNPILGENRNGSIGLPLPDVDCRIVDMENENREVATGEIGELLIRSPQIMQGYINCSDETTAALKDGWLHTGDIAKTDQDGYFYIAGRLKELIKVNGLQVWPAEVEQVIMTYAGVIDTAAAGIPDEESGEAVKAWIVFEDEKQFQLRDFQEHCRKFLAAYKVPRQVEIVNALPKSPVGKTLRRELVKVHLDRKTNPGA